MENKLLSVSNEKLHTQKKYTYSAIILSLMSIFFSLMLIVAYIVILSITLTKNQFDGEEFFKNLPFYAFTNILVVIFGLLGLVAIILTILLIAFISNKECESIFILLIVGLFIPIVGLVGLIKLYKLLNLTLKQKEQMVSEPINIDDKVVQE
ncbi:hypothetical protein [Mycoplasmopsis alligatoris]|uniref:DUF4064 domain-containing protein n=1 Tax=Mycoplasmopsis alligatoris A21JP2 TaxID=747682 RepID=D4XW57_9BACT|nr:hypothetical protein [Mycoplasmopsis alligatoris]EFF41407.1 hypothetical protein MALL_0720 [Mycoplasmopsis alligatoris A21JP2]